METLLKKENHLEIIQKLDKSVVSVLGSENILGFQKAFMVADAIGELKTLLTTEYMKPIMALQGNKLGFKTDKDSSGGYAEAVVKNCLIEAVLYGVQPTGNQFNIIAGNMYITKEGMGYLLDKIPGLHKEISFQLPRINADKSSAAIIAKIAWSINGGRLNEREIEIPVRMNSAMGTDAVIGKATRKARHWLYTNITKTELPEGDIVDIDSKVMGSALAEINVEDLQLLFDMKAENLTPDEANNAERIIKEGETASYKKLLTFLQSK